MTVKELKAELKEIQENTKKVILNYQQSEKYQNGMVSDEESDLYMALLGNWNYIEKLLKEGK